MAVNSPIPAGTVSTRMLPPHIRRKRVSGGSGSSSGGSSPEERKYPLGEPLDRSYAVWMGADGKLYKATALQDKPAVGFNKSAGELGDYSAIISSGETSIAGAAFTVGGAVYLADGADNVSQTLPERSTGNLRQCLGVAVSPVVVEVAIAEPVRYGEV